MNIICIYIYVHIHVYIYIHVYMYYIYTCICICRKFYKAGLFEHRVTGHQFPMVSHVPKIADDDRQEIVCARYKTLELLRWDGTARGGQLSHGFLIGEAM